MHNNRKEGNTMASFTERMIGASKLNAATYEEVEHDQSAMAQSAGVVVLSSLAAGIGSIAYAGVATGLLLGTLAALLGWLIWAFLTWLIGTKLLPEASTEADIGQLMRTIGFASAPGILRVLGIIPALGGLIVLLCNIWMLATMIVAVRQALDYSSTWRAVGVCLIGWVVLLVVQAVIIGLTGAPGAATS
jgi:hypothetical protein